MTSEPKRVTEAEAIILPGVGTAGDAMDKLRAQGATAKVPRMGWNQVKQRIPHPVFEGIPDGANFYFVHSYYADVLEKSLVIGETDYGITFCSILAKDNLVASQFHLEKSGLMGLRMLHNFLKLGRVKT